MTVNMSLLTKFTRRKKHRSPGDGVGVSLAGEFAVLSQLALRGIGVRQVSH